MPYASTCYLVYPATDTKSAQTSVLLGHNVLQHGIATTLQISWLLYP